MELFEHYQLPCVTIHRHGIKECLYICDSFSSFSNIIKNNQIKHSFSSMVLDEWYRGKTIIPSYIDNTITSLLLRHRCIRCSQHQIARHDGFIFREPDVETHMYPLEAPILISFKFFYEDVYVTISTYMICETCIKVVKM